jgi:hypothetical protein
MIKFISFLIPTIQHKLNSFDDFFFRLEEETQNFLEELGSYYLLGLGNYSYDGCLEYANAEQLLEEHDVLIDDYIEETKDSNLTIINLVEYLGY